MFKILKDYTICYDGIRPLSLVAGETLDIKALLPNPEKAEKFHARLVGLGVVATEPVKAAIDAANTFADMKKKELQKFLDDAGIEYESDANKDRLIELAIEAIEPVQD